MSDRIKLKLINQSDWSLIVNDQGELWIAKDDSIFNPLDKNWTHIELLEAEQFLENVEFESKKPVWFPCRQNILNMIKEVDSAIDQRHKWDLIEAQEN